MSEQVPATPPAFQPARVQDILRRSQGWARLCSIMWFIGCAFAVLFGVGLGVAGLVAQQPGMAVLVVIYPLMGVLYLIPAVYVHRFANRARAFAASGQLHDLESALDSQRSFWKFLGILTLVGVAVAILAVVAGGLAGFFWAARMRS